MFQFVYVSAANGNPKDDDLLALLRQSRRSNLRDDLIEALLYKGGVFTQLLEGSEPAGRTVMEPILVDPVTIGFSRSSRRTWTDARSTADRWDVRTSNDSLSGTAPA